MLMSLPLHSCKSNDSLNVPSLVAEDSDLCGQYFGPEDLVLDALEAVALVGLVRRVHATPHPLEQSQLEREREVGEYGWGGLSPFPFVCSRLRQRT